MDINSIYTCSIAHTTTHHKKDAHPNKKNPTCTCTCMWWNEYHSNICQAHYIISTGPRASTLSILYMYIETPKHPPEGGPYRQVINRSYEFEGGPYRQVINRSYEFESDPYRQVSL